MIGSKPEMLGSKPKMIGSKPEEEEENEDDILFDLPTNDDMAMHMEKRFGLVEMPGGIGVDSCASNNVMDRAHLPGYKVHQSEGSRRGHQWGSASGHPIKNEGQVTYRFVTEAGSIAKGCTQM